MSIDAEINRYLIPLCNIHRRFKIIIGGRGSAKTVSVARLMAIYASAGQKICCFRQFWSSIEDSQYTEIVDAINELELEGFEVQATKINHISGGIIRFKGLDRNISSKKGLKGFNKFWLEEGQDITEVGLRTITPTLREEGSEFWVTANPQRREDPLSQRFIERVLPNVDGKMEYDDLVARVKINYMDNYWFPHSMEIERADDYARLDRALYNHIWLGAYNDSVADSVIKAEWVSAAVGARQKLKWQKFGEVIAAHDPADSGDARTTLIKQGNEILTLHNELKLDINDACEQSCEMAREAGARHFIYDADGLGAGLRKQIKDYFPSGVEIYEFRGAGEKESPDIEIFKDSAGRSITNKMFYKNIRSQMYSRLADTFERTYRAVEKGEYIDPQTLISISPDCDNIDIITSELTSIPRYRNNTGVYQVWTKKDIKQILKMKSPNAADVFMMSCIDLRAPRKKLKSIAPDLDFA